MKSLTLSDAHIWFGVANDFHVSDSVLIAFFERMLCVYDFIVLCGDWFELLKENLYSDEENWHAIAAAYPVLVVYLRQRIEEGKVIYVNGNHDSYIRTGKVFPKAVKKFLWTSPDKKVRILWEHGHHGDFVCKKLGVVSRVGVWIGSILEKWNIIDADTLWNWLTKRHGDPGKPTFEEFYKYINKRAKEFKAQAVICGHTHEVLLQEELQGSVISQERHNHLEPGGVTVYTVHSAPSPDLVVANSGCCVNVPADGKFPTIHAEWNPGDTMPKVKLKYMEMKGD
jgi:UDP-2,3-diacylglucosamine pyrophosphatase LpxH